MAYSTSNPPALVSQPIAGPRTWVYQSTDADTVVDAAGYITDGQERGMKVGDQVLVLDNDASPVKLTSHVVVSLSTTNESVDLSDGINVGSTDSD